MTMRKILSRSRWLPIGAAALLAACGGGGSSVAVPTDPFVMGSEVPLSATTSAAGAFAFVRSLAETRSETAEPIVVGDVTLATSDTDEPQSF